MLEGVTTGQTLLFLISCWDDEWASTSEQIWGEMVLLAVVSLLFKLALKLILVCHPELLTFLPHCYCVVLIELVYNSVSK